ncbi:hypothetical protein ASG52_17565 [Methylobacterium sp. Leaf456]|uniref:DUF4089 domain-containing protein n=1 Tax=Methylobacterium sp. Leaf456 TaxID=1736382 RepID=UPI0006FB25C3|nr:DUF4089 domain-containing protein [Methylobacterium sp. Leaf456]KQT61042.1 hypothetical protein ASG52_17565 [Methylobacterium sp. Leaf456]
MCDESTPPAFDPEAYAGAVAGALGIALDPAWIAPVAANLRVLHAAAATVGAFPLPDEAEAAPVFTA